MQQPLPQLLKHAYTPSRAKEVCEQVYKFRAFSPTIAQQINQYLLQQGRMKQKQSKQGIPKKVVCVRGMGFSEPLLACFQKNYNALAEKLWETFKIADTGCIDAEVYSPQDSYNDKHLMNDAAPLTLLIGLQSPTKGGGIYYPRWKTRVILQPGEALFQPGGVSHEYFKLPVIEGLESRLMCELF